MAVFPILDRPRFEEILKQFRTSAEVYVLVTSLCAAESSSAWSKIFMMEARRVKAANTTYFEAPVVADVLANFFLFSASAKLKQQIAAFFHLREAITMAQVLDLHEESTYAAMKDELEALCNRRIFWLLFVTERYVFLGGIASND
jgi:hypothetical protein